MKFIFFVILLLILVGFSSSFDRELTEVERNALFDIFIEIPDEYHAVGIDESILFTLRLVNLGGAGRIDVFLEYSILDMNNNVVLYKRETVAIETQASFLREFGLEGIPTGNYDLYAKMIYADDKVVDSRHSFEIRDPETEKDFTFWSIVGIVFFIGIIVLLYPKIKLIENKIKIKSKVRNIIKDSKIS